MTTGNHLHHSSDPSVVEALPEQNFLKEGPTNSGVRLMEIDLHENRPEVFRPYLMEDFMKY